MKNSLKTIGFVCAGIIFLATLVVLCLVLFCINWIYESIYQTFFPQKWKSEQERHEAKNLSRGWAYQPNIFGEH